MRNAKNEEIFVWTKIGDDAGELINGILTRKDAERRAGTFWWGIGSSLNREKLKSALTSCGETLPVLFSGQLTPPQQGGSGGMTLWTRWMDDTGSYEIPRHALVISKGRSIRYYALVCQSENSIAALRYQPFDDQKFRNYPDGARPGNSQNTALLTGSMHTDNTNGRYRKGFSAGRSG